jgi:hypothetical protein
MAHIGDSFASTPASAAFISFSEATEPIAVSTDITNSVITTGDESASLSLGNVTGASTLLFRRQMTNMGYRDRRRWGKWG